MPTGRIIDWNDAKGFGFIEPEHGGSKVFFHITDYPQDCGRPRVGERVEYVPACGDRGPRATLLIVTTPKRERPVHPGTWIAAVVAGGFLAIVALLTISGRVPAAIPALYIVFSVAIFAAYALDKRSARDGQWRIPERVLHFYSLLGGWPGALIAQQYFRHKTRKESFLVVFWLAVLTNCVALGALGYFGIDRFLAAIRQ